MEVERVEVTPEPTAAIADAIAAALRRRGAGQEPQSAWWRAGIDEAVRAEPDGA